MEICTTLKAYTIPGMYCERKELLNVLLRPWLENGVHQLDEFCIVAKRPCPVEDLPFRASNWGLPIHIPEGMIKAEECR